jgi:hypothetical protein
MRAGSPDSAIQVSLRNPTGLFARTALTGIHRH